MGGKVWQQTTDIGSYKLSRLFLVGLPVADIAAEVGVDPMTVNRTVAESTIVDSATPLPGKSPTLIDA